MKRAVLCALVLAASAAGAASPERYAQGLEQHTEGDARDGIVVLRPVPQGRVHIPGGTFTMGSTPVQMMFGKNLCLREPLGTVQLVTPNGNIYLHCYDSRFLVEGVAHQVTLSSFWMDRTEVRVGDYMRCVSAGSCNAPGFSPGDARFSRPELPVVLVTWEEARDYCSFAKGRLPTEAEWEYAARGTVGRTFPWGNDWNPHLANHGSIALDPTDATDGFAGLAPVGSIPDGKTSLGLLDMAGNAAEWVGDVAEAATDARELIAMPYAPDAVTDPRPLAAGATCTTNAECASRVCEEKVGVNDCSSGTCVPKKTCAGTGTMRIIRGGSYLQGADSQRATSRVIATGSRRNAGVGFRCAAND